MTDITANKMARIARLTPGQLIKATDHLRGLIKMSEVGKEPVCR